MGTLMQKLYRTFLMCHLNNVSKLYSGILLGFYCLFLFNSCNQGAKTDSIENKSDGNTSVYKTLDQIAFNGDTSNTGMVSIPGGEFMMGADNDQADKDEYPKHKVILDPFWIDQHEVTNDQFAKFIEST